ncbi:dGTPase [Corallococcus sp. NCSPR001]|nr:anti-phage deoxyguanosine triphosphatase [Corallococcus sp. NCSPR001]MBN9686624.1 dGTPase [Corallococcus sp. NCSPR001]WAS81954.1 anti-phage deoxyguanosine triphosphatase [Corallococcus sp. NCRR]
MDSPWEQRRLPESPRSEDRRDGYERDRSRIIHSAAFRRLQAKTQVLGIGEGDFHRTRLTHSMEAAQISRGLLYVLGRQEPDLKRHLPPTHLLEAICLAHDLGHPPFGHTGETALNLAMLQHGGFEGNGQTLRLLAKLEAHTESYGLNPTRRTLLGVLKYPTSYSQIQNTETTKIPNDRFEIRWNDWKPPKCYLDDDKDVVDFILEPLPSTEKSRFTEPKALATKNKHGKPKWQSLDTSIMTLADDIAFGVHDLEDAAALGLIEQADIENIAWDPDSAWATKFEVNKSLHKIFSKSHHIRKQATGALVNAFIQASRWAQQDEFETPLLKYNARLTNEADALLSKLKDVEFERVINTHTVQTLEYRGGHLVLELFKAIAAAPEKLLPETFRIEHKTRTGKEAMRVICDYVSGMTDEFATKQYERLFVPRRGSALSPA